ncbi:hypothetical protein GCM10010388_44410 [Streptomyces mauvecolor]
MSASAQIKDEYSTYPPAESRCSECDERFRPLMPARRFQSAGDEPTTVRYRHFECTERAGH